MGNVFRFVEPLILLDLRNHPGASGYDILLRLEGHTLTGTTIDKAAVYRGPGRPGRERDDDRGVDGFRTRCAGRKSYRLTPLGRKHLQEWAEMLEELSNGLREFVEAAKNGAGKA